MGHLKRKTESNSMFGAKKRLTEESEEPMVMDGTTTSQNAPSSEGSLTTRHRFLHNAVNRVHLVFVNQAFMPITTKLHGFPYEHSISAIFNKNNLARLKQSLPPTCRRIKVIKEGTRISDVIVLSDKIQSSSGSATEVSSFVQSGKVILFEISEKTGHSCEGFRISTSILADKTISGTIGIPASTLVSTRSESTGQPSLVEMNTSDSADYSLSDLFLVQAKSRPHPVWDKITPTYDFELTDSADPTSLSNGIAPSGKYSVQPADTVADDSILSYTPDLDRARTAQQEEVLMNHPFRAVNPDETITLDNGYVEDIYTTSKMFQAQLAATALERQSGGADPVSWPMWCPWSSSGNYTKHVGQYHYSPFNPEAMSGFRKPVHFLTMRPIVDSTGAVLKIRANVFVEERIHVIAYGDEIATMDSVQDDVTSITDQFRNLGLHVHMPLQEASTASSYSVFVR